MKYLFQVHDAAAWYSSTMIKSRLQLEVQPTDFTKTEKFSMLGKVYERSSLHFTGTSYTSIVYHEINSSFLIMQKLRLPSSRIINM